MHKTNITEMQTRHMTRMNRITILLVCLFTKYVQCFGFANVLNGQRAPCSKLSSAFDDYADNLFNRFDKDSSGFIDRNEFRDVAKKMRVDNSRREVISVATAFASSLFVVTESDTFLNLDKSNFAGNT